MIYLVLISVKGGYKVHSSHDNEESAKQWGSCKQHDGDDTNIAYIDNFVLDEILHLPSVSKLINPD